ncbi:MAG: hypothetical protein ACOY0S_04110 [Patescibacteria group bacterium]
MEFDAFSVNSWLRLLMTSFWFGLAVWLAFYLPAATLLSKVFSKTEPLVKFITFLSLGLVFWAFQGVVFGYLGVRWASYVYLIIFATLYFRQKRRPFLKIKPDFWLIIIFVLGIFGQVNRFAPTGLIFPAGIYILTGASDDAFWHAALTGQLVRNFPPAEPGLSGVLVTNYHYWSNLVSAELVRVFHLPLMAVQFIYMPLLLSFLLGGLAYTLARELNFSRIGVYLTVYLQYFASDVIYLTSFITSGKFEFRVHPLEDGTMFWENPPRAFSIVISLLGIILLKRWLKSKDFGLGLALVLVMGSVIGFKVHTGIVVLGALGGLVLYTFLKRELAPLLIFFGSLLVAALVYFPVNRGAGLPIFVPFELTRMFAVQEKLHLSYLELRRRIFTENFNPLRALQMDLTMLVIFTLSQFGIRNLGWLAFVKSIRVLGSVLTIFLYSGVLAGFVLGTIFIQPVAGADMFNAYLASSIFLWVLACILLNFWLASKRHGPTIILISLILLMTLPRWFYKTYFPPSAWQKAKPSVTRAELAALTYLRTQTNPEALVLVANTGQWDSMYPYVSIFAERNMYLSGQTILERHGINFVERKGVAQQIFSASDSKLVISLLKRYSINYLYFYGDPPLPRGLSGSGLVRVFQNEGNTIYQIPN